MSLLQAAKKRISREQDNIRCISAWFDAAKLQTAGDQFGKKSNPGGNYAISPFGVSEIPGLARDLVMTIVFLFYNKITMP